MEGGDTNGLRGFKWDDFPKKKEKGKKRKKEGEREKKKNKMGRGGQPRSEALGVWKVDNPIGLGEKESRNLTRRPVWDRRGLGKGSPR